MDLEALKDKQPESTATITSMTAGKGMSNTEEDQNAEDQNAKESKNSSTAEVFATAGTSSITKSQRSELLFSET
jgi:hypothetical protein